MEYPKVKFPAKDPSDFFKLITQKVNVYFEQNKIEKSGNFELFFKTGIMFSLYFVPLFIVYAFPTINWLLIVCYIISGLGLSGIGLCVMHDANHGAFSKFPKLNAFFGYSLNLIGGSSFTWKIQHNVLHHTYTNILHLDEDIKDKTLLRLSPEDKLKSVHRYQHIYGPFLYCFATISWVLFKDFKQYVIYKNNGIAKQFGYHMKTELIILILSKVFFAFYIIALPIWLGASVGTVLLGFLFMQMLAGFIITMVFQLAHVVEGPEHHHPPSEGLMKNTWAIHQLRTTANFAGNSRIVSWLTGGLNHQIEHHLFPTISHVHYRKISKIIQEVAKECNLPYHEFPNVLKAVVSHIKVLKAFGNTALVKG